MLRLQDVHVAQREEEPVRVGDTAGTRIATILRFMVQGPCAPYTYPLLAFLLIFVYKHNAFCCCSTLKVTLLFLQPEISWPVNSKGYLTCRGRRFADGGEKQKCPCGKDLGARHPQVVKIISEPSTAAHPIACVASAR